MLTGYLGEQIEACFGDGKEFGLRISYCRERFPLGTGGALREARWALAESFLLIYGDSYLPITYRELGIQLEASGPEPSWRFTATPPGKPTCQPISRSARDGSILRYDKRSGNTDPDLRYIDAGVLALRRSVLDLIPEEGPASLEERIFPELIRQQRLLGHVTSQRFYDMGTPERLRVIEEYLA